MWWIPRLEAPWSELLDIAVVAMLVYGLLITIRGARAHLALLGMGILGIIYFVSQQIGLLLTASIFQAFFAVFLILLVVIFQAELRQVFERVAVLGLRSQHTRMSETVDQILVSTLTKLAEARIGALVVIRAEDPIGRHVRGGIPLEGRLSEPLLLSIFDPGSPGHDGAVVLHGDRVERFAVHLPLSSNVAQLRNRGTRHAAALGLSERTDALCLVVSEERGQVSAAHRSQLVQLRNAAAISERLRSFAELQHLRAEEASGGGRLLRALHSNWREAASALALAVLLWVAVVPGSETVERRVVVPVEVSLPDDFELQSVDPPQVEAVFSGLRRDFFFFDAAQVAVRVDGLLVRLGRRTFKIEPDAVAYPPELSLVKLTPDQLKVSVRVKPSVPAPAAGSE
jgi:diadenylate cyclase